MRTDLAQKSSRTGTRLRDDNGASAVEYALLVVGIAAVIVAVVFTLGLITQSNYTGVCSAWDAAASTTDC